ncbi:DUF3667 domain-containing protein [Erythrobacter sp.]|jgi:hypothetical protein|uniref:DUF3667 domain-containing protein n=1 Tax=Erythrobacter sp. TaxID=1042 RepID=UPI002EADBB55|nr:DUF3667 domain-containing protein [Erythrobacter sp.]
MSDVAEGIGGAIEGALTGRAVEPKHGEADREKAVFDPSLATGEDDICLNCGARADSNFCPNCGQKTHIHRTLSAIGHDLIHGVLHLDGKLWRTLPLLTFRPGRLTRRYIEGERADFVSPMAMFLFSVFAMFAIFQMIGLSTPATFDDQVGIDQVESSLSSAIENNERTLREIEQELAADTLDEEERSDLETRKAELEGELEGLSAMADLPFIDAKRPEIEVRSDGTRVIPMDGGGNARVTMGATGIDWIDDGLAKKWKENPGLMLYKLQANAYKFSWLLILLSIPFVWLIFAWKRRFKAYDHAIFVTYSLAFTSLLFIVVSVLFTIPSLQWLAGLLIAFVPPIHLYKHLRGTYELSRFSAFWRLLVLSAFIWIVVILFLQSLLLLGAF